MTEKDYSGATTRKINKGSSSPAHKIKPNIKPSKESPSKDNKNDSEEGLTKEQIESYKKAGQINIKVKEFARNLIKPGMLLSKIAEAIEAKTKELGGEIAFPVSLGVDDVAAHYTPNLDSNEIATGLLKVDVGVHINGFIADSAFTLDLTPTKEHKKIIEATELALKKALEIISEKNSFRSVGKIIHETITNQGFSPVRNLSGHSLEENEIHAGETIPNYDNGNDNQPEAGAYAIEPFATYGSGVVYEAGESNVYQLISERPIRDQTARKILAFIQENKKTLPFSQRELEKIFGSRTKLALSQLERANIIKHYGKLIEKTHKPVTQAEHTVLLYNNKKEIITE